MYLRLNPAKWLSQDMWLQNSCHPSVIPCNLIENNSWDIVQSGHAHTHAHTKSELKSNQELAKYLVFAWPESDLFQESFIWLQPAGGRVGKVEVGFCVFKFNCPPGSRRIWDSWGFLCDAQKTTNDQKQNNNTGARLGSRPQVTRSAATSGKKPKKKGSNSGWWNQA